MPLACPHRRGPLALALFVRTPRSMRGAVSVPAEPEDGPAAAFSTSWLQHLRDQEGSSDSDCETGASSSDDETVPSDAEQGTSGWAGGARPSRTMDESFGTALKRLKNNAVLDASPNTKFKADVEFRRLAKSNNRAGKFIRRRAAPSKEQQQREKDEAEQRRKVRHAPAAQDMRRLQNAGQMFPVISARDAAVPATAGASQQPQPPPQGMSARPPTHRKIKNPKTPRARSASVPNSIISSLPVPHLNTPRTGRGVSARVKQAAMRARSAHILRCPARSTHIAALPMKDYQAPASVNAESDVDQAAASAVGGKRLPEELLSRMAQRRPHMEGLPLVIIAVEGTVLDVCCGGAGYFADGGELQKPVLHVRPGLVEGLRCLSSAFQIALATQLGRKPLLQLLKHLDSHSVAVDAIYMLSGASGAGGSGGGDGASAAAPSGWGHRAAAAAANTTQDYTAVYSDFGIRSHEVGQRVLVVSALNLDLDEVSARDGSRLLYTPSVSAPNFAARLPTPVDLSERFDHAGGAEPSNLLPGAAASSSSSSPREDRPRLSAASAVPRAAGGGSGIVPVVLLVPNPMSHAEFRALPMTAVASAVHALASSKPSPPAAAEKYAVPGGVANDSRRSSSGNGTPNRTTTTTAAPCCFAFPSS